MGSIPSNAEVINAQNKHVYPGFILVNNTLGLVEISATNATVDYREANDISPEVRSLISFNTDSHVIPSDQKQWRFIDSAGSETRYIVLYFFHHATRRLELGRCGGSDG